MPYFSFFQFSIQIDGERVYVPMRASISIEHERGLDSEEIELQLKWHRHPRHSKTEKEK